MGLPRRRFVVALVLGLACLMGCFDTRGSLEITESSPDTLSPDTSSSADATAESRCAPGPGATGRPTSIAEAIILVNSLPKPTSLACFVESLDRPIGIEATASVNSAQPAVGRRSPRLFLFNDPLIMSIALAGQGRHLLEFGQLVDETQSIKGEIEFPVTEQLEPSAPFDRIRLEEGEGTTCGGCHDSERPATDIDASEAYVSRAFRPVDRKSVSVERVHREYRECNPDEEPKRCALLSALFDHGEIRQQGLPERLPTIFD